MAERLNLVRLLVSERRRARHDGIRVKHLHGDPPSSRSAYQQTTHRGVVPARGRSSSRAWEPDSGTAARIGTAYRDHHFARHHRDGEELLYATRSRSRSEYGSISTTIFLTTTLGVLRRPTVFIVMKPAASNFASVRVKFG